MASIPDCLANGQVNATLGLRVDPQGTSSSIFRFESYQAALSSLYDQVWTTGCRLNSSMAAMLRFLSSCLDATRIWRSTERASLEKKPSTRLSQEPCLGVKVNSKRPAGCSASQALVSLEMCAE